MKVFALVFILVLLASVVVAFVLDDKGKCIIKYDYESKDFMVSGKCSPYKDEINKAAFEMLESESICECFA